MVDPCRTMTALLMFRNPNYVVLPGAAERFLVALTKVGQVGRQAYLATGADSRFSEPQSRDSKELPAIL
jgi:hypothetical protein